jgi:uncharacterized membrane-anchored protein YjiN (DUF445 family)
VTTAAVDPVPPPVEDEAVKQRQLSVMRRRATGLLVVVAAVYVAVTALEDGAGGPMGYLRATAEASMIGGLADWFAVTALFRHPLGIPIPHTAVVVERKEQFGRTLGAFVQRNFLSPTVIGERIASSRAVPRLAAWLAEPANAEVVAGHASAVAVGLADVVRDEDVHELVEEEVLRRLEQVPVAPLAGKALELVLEQEGHQELLDAMLRGVDGMLDGHRDDLRRRFGEESPWWLPDALDDRIFDKLFEGVRKVLHDVSIDPDHELRRAMNERLRALVDDLETSEALRQQGEEFKRDLLASPELRRWSASLWDDVKARLRAQADDPDSALRRRLAATVAAAGQRLCDDPALRSKLEDLVEAAARYTAEQFHDEIADLVTGTVARWDATETSQRLELLLGPDLQYIRINGTVVGGLAGLVIHATTELVG